MTKKVAAYSEILYHLINFRTEQFQQLKKMVGIDYDSFMILSVMGAHYLKHNNKLGSDWDAVWEDVRTSKIDEFYTARKLTIYAVANILNLPRETVRRKIEILKKKKLINHSTTIGLLPTNKTEELMKPFAEIELKTLSKFLKSLKKNGTLDAVLNFKNNNNFKTYFGSIKPKLGFFLLEFIFFFFIFLCNEIY